MDDFQWLTAASLLLMVAFPPFIILLDRLQGPDIRPLPPRMERLLLALKLVLAELVFGTFFAVGLVALLDGYTTFGQRPSGSVAAPAWWAPTANGIAGLVTLIPITGLEMSGYVARRRPASEPTSTSEPE